MNNSSQQPNGPLGKRQKVSLLGSTGSIGLSTLDVIRQHRDRFEVFALAAQKSVVAMFSQVCEFRPELVVLEDRDSAVELQLMLDDEGIKTKVYSGKEALVEVAQDSLTDIVVAAIVGAAGLPSTMAAVEAGKKVLLANKESLVMAGQLFMDAAREKQSELLPVDSEHNAIFQSLPQPFLGLEQAGVRRLLLTGSGGPFRSVAIGDMDSASPQQACAHPNWSMGKKISVDSATMMNKGLEFIEAGWLFSAEIDQIQVVVHPQSIVHSMVEYVDGSVIAQLGQPDMRTPIANCLGWPDRLETKVEHLDFFKLAKLEFCEPDYGRFPCLNLARQAMIEGGTAPAALNAANEVAVDAFLSERIRFGDISGVVDHVLQSWDVSEPQSLEEVLQADEKARRIATKRVVSGNRMNSVSVR